MKTPLLRESDHSSAGTGQYRRRGVKLALNSAFENGGASLEDVLTVGLTVSLAPPGLLLPQSEGDAFAAPWYVLLYSSELAYQFTAIAPIIIWKN